MRIALIAVIRNEIDIVRPFLAHVAALFDHVLLLDHGSVDGTEHVLQAACAGRSGWARWRVAVPGHHQALFSGFAMRHLFQTTDADFVLFLDADEFIDVADRAGLEAALGGIAGQRAAGRFAWVDTVPERLDGSGLRHGDVIWARADAAPFFKVVISRNLYVETAGALGPSAGNHTVNPGDGGPIAYRTIGGLLHLPLRSVAQFRQKIVTGTLSVLARRDNAPHESSHWFAALHRLAANDVAQADLIDLACGYGHQPDASRTVAMADLPRLGFTRRRLDVAATDIRLPTTPAIDPWRVVAAVIRDWQAEDGRELQLELLGDLLRRSGDT